MANRHSVLPRITSIEDAQTAFANNHKAQSFQVLKQSWVEQRCKYDTIPELGNANWRMQQFKNCAPPLT
jgi:hypothetical protein